MSSESDLQHFLKLSAAQLANRIKTEKAAQPTNLTTLSNRVQQMRMLEELLKEQITNENTGTATR
jgi:hypothetical protein